MPLNDDVVLGKLTDPKTYPGDSQEDLNLDLMLSHDQNLLLKFIKYRVGRYTIEDLLNDLRESDDRFWERVLKAIILNYHLINLEMFITDTVTENFAKHIIDLYRDLKITMIDDILEQKITVNMTREELENVINTYQSILLKWSIRFITREDFEKFMMKIFQEYKSPMFQEGDDF